MPRRFRRAPSPRSRCRRGGRAPARGRDGLRDARLERCRRHAAAQRNRARTPSRAIARSSTSRTRRRSRTTPRSTSRSPGPRPARPGGIVSASRRTARRSRCASTSRCSGFPTTATGRARPIRASATSAISFKDYAQPIQGSLEQDWIARHRLERVNPNDPNSPIKNPIVYYVDRGIPEPMRTGDVPGRELVGGGVRPGRAQGRVQGGVAPRGRRPDGRALQRRAVGESQRARLERRRRAERSAHRRNAQGDGAPRFTPRAHRLQHLRRVHGRRRVGGRHGVRPRARPPGERARGRPHARPRPQLHREHVRARVGDGLSRAARRAEGRPDRPQRGVRRGAGRVRRVGDSLGIRHFPARRTRPTRSRPSWPTACGRDTCT